MPTLTLDLPDDLATTLETYAAMVRQPVSAVVEALLRARRVTDLPILWLALGDHAAYAAQHDVETRQHVEEASA